MCCGVVCVGFEVFDLMQVCCCVLMCVVMYVWLCVVASCVFALMLSVGCCVELWCLWWFV